MSEDQLRAFLEAVRADPGLWERLKGQANVDAVIAIASEAGFVINRNDLDNCSHAYPSTELGPVELGDEDLERVAGGTALAIDCLVTIKTWCIWNC